MTITELKNCIEKMRECYNFDDDNTQVRLGSECNLGNGREVRICTEDKNGTRIVMERYCDEMVKREVNA